MGTLGAFFEPMTQDEAILWRLQRGDILTQLDTLNDPNIRCLRLAARIWELKGQGHPIETINITTDTGKTIAGYRMRPVEENGQVMFAI